MNLATARATQRAKEVGLRKAVGGTRSQLIRQFIGESLLLAVIAVGVAIVIVVAALGPFAAFVERDIGLDDLARPEVVAAVVAIALLVAVGAGSYPAFLLSAFKPRAALRGQVARGATAGDVPQESSSFSSSRSRSRSSSRRSSSFEQRRFAETIELGYETEQIVVLTGSQDAALGPQWESMKRQLESVPGVAAVTASNVVPGTRTGTATQVRHIDDDNGFGGFVASLMLVDFGFLETYEIDVARRPLVLGSERRPRDRAAAGAAAAAADVVRHERLAVERLGWTPDEVVGRISSNVSGRTRHRHRRRRGRVSRVRA